MTIVIYEDTSRDQFYPLSLNRPVFSLKLGMFSLSEKIKYFYPHDKCLYLMNEELKNIFPEHNELKWDEVKLSEEYLFISGRVILSEILNISVDQMSICENEILAFRLKGEKVNKLKSEFFFQKDKLKNVFDEWKMKSIDFNGIKLNYLHDMISQNENEINSDFIKLLDSNKINDYNNGENIKSCIIGDNKNILIHKNARIYPGVYFLCDNGRIVIDSNANIKPLSIIDGSCYIGKNALIETAKVGGGTSIFDFCKIGGEVENSIVLEMSNKHHEGFLGHSYVGSYVNLGALSCTSDLKNNYGDVTVTLKGKKVNTKSLKLGAFIGDHTKLGIGSLINTGSVIGLGCNLYSEGGMYPKEIPSFLWGGKIPFKEYIFDKFIENCKKVLKRRNKILNNEEIKLFKKIYQCEQETRNYFKISS